MIRKEKKNSNYIPIFSINFYNTEYLNDLSPTVLFMKNKEYMSHTFPFIRFY